MGASTTDLAPKPSRRARTRARVTRASSMALGVTSPERATGHEPVSWPVFIRTTIDERVSSAADRAASPRPRGATRPRISPDRWRCPLCTNNLRPDRLRLPEDDHRRRFRRRHRCHHCWSRRWRRSRTFLRCCLTSRRCPRFRRSCRRRSRRRPRCPRCPHRRRHHRRLRPGRRCRCFRRIQRHRTPRPADQARSCRGRRNR